MVDTHKITVWINQIFAEFDIADGTHDISNIQDNLENHGILTITVFDPRAPTPGEVDGKKKVVSHRQRSSRGRSGPFFQPFARLRPHTGGTSASPKNFSFVLSRWFIDVLAREYMYAARSIASWITCAAFRCRRLRAISIASRTLTSDSSFKPALTMPDDNFGIINLCMPDFSPGRMRGGIGSLIDARFYYRYDSIIHLHKQSDWITLREWLAESPQICRNNTISVCKCKRPSIKEKAIIDEYSLRFAINLIFYLMTPRNRIYSCRWLREVIE